jgi:hypothetical protein
MKTERLDKLYFRYLQNNPPLEGWSIIRLAKRLEELGYIRMVDGTRYHYLPSFEPYLDREHFNELMPTLLAKGDKMKQITKLLCVFALLGLGACSSPPKKQGFNLPPALSEVFRNGELKGLEANTDGDLGIPNQDALVQHVCISKPVFDLYGQYIRTAVKCF